MRELLLARHAHARANERGIADGVPPGEGLSERGVEEARALGAALAEDRVSRVVTSRFRRARQTAELACPGVPALVLDGLDEIRYGHFEGGPLDAYLAWAWASAPHVDPGGGESRVAAVTRVVDALGALLQRDDEVILAVSHGAIVRWVADAAEGRPPSARLEPVEFAVARRLTSGDVGRAAAVLELWLADPVFADDPNGT